MLSCKYCIVPKKTTFLTNSEHFILYGLESVDQRFQSKYLFKSKWKDRKQNTGVSRIVRFTNKYSLAGNNRFSKACLRGLLGWSRKFCLSVCLFVTNKRKNGWTAQHFWGNSLDTREGLRLADVEKCGNLIVLKMHQLQ